MNYYLVAAGCITLVVGFVHSVLGEILVFSKLRAGGVVPTYGGAILKERNVRILWASWHLVTIFGTTLGVILIFLSQSWPQDKLRFYIENAIFLSMLFGSMLVFVATKAKHPGWLGLMSVAILIWFH